MKVEELISKLETEMELPQGTLSENTRLREMDEWDSVHGLIIVAMIDHEYNVIMDVENWNAVNTVSDLFEIIQNHKSVKKD